MRVVLLVALIGCGRFGFAAEPGPDAITPDMSDALVALDAPVFDTVFQMSFEGDPSTGVIADDTGHGHDATCIPAACPTRVAGKRGMGLGFDGTQYALIPSHPAHQTAGGFTITGWIFNSDPLVNRVPFAKPYGSGDRDSWLFISWLDGRICFETTLPGDLREDVCAPGGIVPDTWYHLAGVWDGTTKALYIDGVRALSIPGTPIAFDASDIVIGGDINAGELVYEWQGRIDELRFYDRGLTQAEIAILAAP